MMLMLAGFAVGPAYGETEYDFVVARDGSGDFITVQEAIDAVPHLRKERTTIYISKGVYREKLILSSTKTNVSFIGENVERTVITWDDYASKHNIFLGDWILEEYDQSAGATR
ncbi:MAG: pectinesterase family protein [Bacteroidota bacterium]